ncbi:protodermal factor 1-like isoform X2 [Mangifera indica]|uniref:protodermal factor 1-like isoform X2 n=1 Tax=Mangifera indica TaxID=29780 RepID=UPI001CFBB1E0|nr:protodermal factor 1-like isoform X2 [Mangifera indica]
MARETSASFFAWIMATGLLFQGLVLPAMSIRFEDKKTYYSPNPHSGTPPSGSHGSPPHGNTPSYGSPPSHHGGSHNPTPSHGGSYNPTPSSPSPPSNCGSPPHEPVTPSTPSTPSNPPSGYYQSPPPSGGYSPPVIVSPPYDPGTPTIPSPPFSPIPGTCTYWSNHPTLIWGVLGWWGTLGHAFGVTSAPGFSPNMSLQQALSNNLSDGYGALYREGTASWLNSLVNHRFPFTTDQVRQSFVSAIHSEKTAAAQAQLFKSANEGRFRPRG